MITERREAIKELLRENGEVRLKDLEKQFTECCSMTLRRDLKYLEDNGFVKRTRGGAVAMSMLSPAAAEELYAQREDVNIEGKTIVAEKALAFLPDSGSVYLDSGTTMMRFARIMPDEHMTVVTSGVNIALELIKKQKPQVTLIGGQVNRNTISVSGINAPDIVKALNIDVAFMAASGYSDENGFTSGTYTESELKKEVIRKARRTVLLVDAEKIDRVMAFTFAGLEDVDVLVSDRPLPDEMMQRAAACGVRVM